MLPSKKNWRRSNSSFAGIHTIYGVEGEHNTPYMTRIWFGRLRLHIFHRPDNDPDPHDHPWGFWTFPFTSYVEEVIEPEDVFVAYNVNPPELRPLIAGRTETRYHRKVQVVHAFQWHYRPATHTHRVIGKLVREHPNGGIQYTDKERIYTLVWREPESRSWGFLKNRFGKWCWIGHKEYIFNGGKHTACE